MASLSSGDEAAQPAGGNDAAVKLDRHGNPVGEDLGLAAEQPGSILIYCAKDWAKQIFHDDTPTWAALRKAGFELEFVQGKFPRDKLKEVDQLWLFSSQERDARRVKDDDYTAIVEFVERGGGLYLLSDNDGFTHESNELVGRMFGSYVRGNYKGQHVIAVRREALTSEMRSRYGAEHEGANHALLKGINFLYEGFSISHIGRCSLLETVVAASDGKPLVAVPAESKLKVVVDCGYTRYMRDKREQAAGSTRFAQNIAAYLTGDR